MKEDGVADGVKSVLNSMYIARISSFFSHDDNMELIYFCSARLVKWLTLKPY